MYIYIKSFILIIYIYAHQDCIYKSYIVKYEYINENNFVY